MSTRYTPESLMQWLRPGTGGRLPFMWSTYCRRLPFTQSLILGISAIFRFYFQRDWREVGIFFGLMEFAGLAGAWWGWRLKRKMQDRGG